MPRAPTELRAKFLVLAAHPDATVTVRRGGAGYVCRFEAAPSLDMFFGTTAAQAWTAAARWVKARRHQPTGALPAMTLPELLEGLQAMIRAKQAEPTPWLLASLEYMAKAVEIRPVYRWTQRGPGEWRLEAPTGHVVGRIQAERARLHKDQRYRAEYWWGSATGNAWWGTVPGAKSFIEQALAEMTPTPEVARPQRNTAEARGEAFEMVFGGVTFEARQAAGMLGNTSCVVFTDSDSIDSAHELKIEVGDFGQPNWSTPK